MKNFNFSAMENIKKGLLKSPKPVPQSVHSSAISSPWKGKPGVFYHLWTQQHQTEKQVQSKQTPIVIPVNQSAARFLPQKQTETQQILHEEKQTNQFSERNSKTDQVPAQTSVTTSLPEKERLKLLEFAIPLPVQPNATMPDTLKVMDQQALLEKLIQAAVNSPAVQKQLAEAPGRILSVQFTVPSRIFNEQKSSFMKADPGQSSLKNSQQLKSGNLFFKNVSGLMWQPVENTLEVKQLARQLNLTTVQQIRLNIKPVMNDLFEVTLEQGKSQTISLTRAIQMDFTEQAPTGIQQQKNTRNGISKAKGGRNTAFTKIRLATLEQESPLSTQKNNSLKESLPQAANNLTRLEAGQTSTVNARQNKNQVQFLLKVETQEVEAPQDLLKTAVPSEKGIETAKEFMNINQQQGVEEKLLKIQIHQLAHGSIPTTHHPEISGFTGPQNYSNMEHFIARIKDLVEQAQNMNLRSGQMRMSLEDTPMGKLDLKFQQNERQLTVVVENEHIRSELMRLAPLIQQDLSEKGIVLNSFQVNVGQFAQPEQGKQSTKKGNSTFGSVESGKEENHHESQSTVINRKFGYNTMEITV